jgi:hypothetical protein
MSEWDVHPKAPTRVPPVDVKFSVTEGDEYWGGTNITTDYTIRA